MSINLFSSTSSLSNDVKKNNIGFPQNNNNNNNNNIITNTNNEKKIIQSSSAISHTFSSQLASAISTMTFYPFDTLRIRFMSQDGTIHRQHNGQTYHSIRKALFTIYNEEGIKALFRGCHIAVLGAMTSWGIYMYLYRSFCNFSDISSYYGRAGVSLMASLTATLISSPIWFIKSRMQIEDANLSKNYVTFRKGLTYILQTTGFRSLWRGSSLQLTLVFPNSLNIPTYDLFKGVILKTRGGKEEDVLRSTELSMIESTLCSGVTKALLIVISHPIMMLKIRLQDQRWNTGEIKYTNVRHTVFTILKREGPQGMMRGLCSSLVHSLPRTVTYFVLYEKTLAISSRYI